MRNGVSNLCAQISEIVQYLCTVHEEKKAAEKLINTRRDADEKCRGECAAEEILLLDGGNIN